jgi:nitric oxide reductase NorD protein
LDVARQADALRDFRCMALLQAMRVLRRTPAEAARAEQLGVFDLYLLIEARAAEAQLAQLFPGMISELARFRLDALARRPALAAFGAERRPLERLARAIMRAPSCRRRIAAPASPAQSLERAQLLANRLRARAGVRGVHLALYKDDWCGDLRVTDVAESSAPAPTSSGNEDVQPRSAHLARRPEIREAKEDEDDEGQGAWMIQTAQPHEHAEDPMGMQRPTDRDQETAAEEFADALSELPEARLVSSPTPSPEILLSEDLPAALAKKAPAEAPQAEHVLSYPEWDWRAQAYRTPGVIVHVLAPQLGPMQWVEQTMRTHRAMCDSIRRRFEMLRAQRIRLRRQLDGEDLDLDAYVEARADYRAGRSLSHALYQCTRTTQRDTAITLLIDISGSTDGWIAAHRRVIDVEREALLLVCIALEGLAEPYSVLAFSGEGPGGVTVRQIKDFAEPYASPIAQRIAALEPERYTRAGAAIRHASSLLMRQKARHRLLLLLSDGKPNDMDEYEGRYGVEDMRQAVIEARLQGISPFCLTIDRQAAGYLPQVFGPAQYALLPKPELLPSVLLEWIKRLIAG